jgi:hypothetical protein
MEHDWEERITRKGFFASYHVCKICNFTRTEPPCIPIKKLAHRIQEKLNGKS